MGAYVVGGCVGGVCVYIHGECCGCVGVHVWCGRVWVCACVQVPTQSRTLDSPTSSDCPLSVSTMPHAHVVYGLTV